MIQQAVPPNHRNELAEKIMLAILNNSASNAYVSVVATLPEFKKTLAQHCLEMANAMIACQKADEEERQ